MNNYYPNYNPAGYYPNAYNSYNNISTNPYNQMMASQQPPTISTLNGKIVDTVDVVKVTEVPIGGYGIFPKADLSEIYIKSWNNNGTTNVITFKPEIQDAEGNELPPQDNPLEVIIQRLSSLENKIDNIVVNPVVITEEVKEKAEKEFKF